MAERRMFAKTIIDSDAFLDMPLSAQALYFHLSMRADDEGFINNPKKVQRMIGATEDDMKILIAKNFVICFETGIIVIKHWRIHNYIRADRLVETKYKDERELLEVKENGAYTFNKELLELEQLDAKDKRKIAYKESSLPYCFTYKIRRAFEGRVCPVCNKKMKSAYKTTMPTIQHNLPISKGGKHELENISVICESCNTSLQDTETDALNNEEVIDVWDRIIEAERQKIKWMDNPDKLEEVMCLPSDSQVSDTCPSNVRIGKVRLGKERLGKVRLGEEGGSSEPLPEPKKPIKEKYGEYKHVKLTQDEFDRLCDDFGESLTLKAIKAVDEYVQEKGKTYKDYNLTIRRWGIDAAKKNSTEPATQSERVDDIVAEWKAKFGRKEGE